MRNEIDFHTQRRQLKILLSVAKMKAIAQAIELKRGRLLVFGAGNDSKLWMDLNTGQESIFLEDNKHWLKRLCAEVPTLQVFQIKYETSLSKWWKYALFPFLLKMQLPTEISSKKWDVILVDGPAGFALRTPGRMKSIYMAARLAAPGAIVLLDDCDRPVEALFAWMFLEKNSVLQRVENMNVYDFSEKRASAQPSRLRHFLNSPLLSSAFWRWIRRGCKGKF